MKSFIGILFVVCGIIAAAWYGYEPYIKPLLERDVVSAEQNSSSANQDAPSAIPENSQPEQPKPQIAKPEPKPEPTKVVKADPPAPKPKSEVDQLLEQRYPMPQIIPLMTIVKNWSAVPPNAYPQTVVATEPVPFDLIVNGQKLGSSSVAPGSPLKPVRLSNDTLVIANVANPAQSSQIHVDKTNFKQQITQRYNDFVAFKTGQITKARNDAKRAIAERPELLAVLKGEESRPADDAGDPRFGAVKASLKAGECPSVTLEEANSFRWNGKEEIVGDYPGTYDTVTVSFSVKTIFGQFPVKAKALLVGGRVKHWIDPITQERMD